MTIYIDNEYKCYVNNDGTMREFDAKFFDGKCPAFIEGHYYIPLGEIRIGVDGTVFQGEQITPWVDNRLLEKAQLEYELEQLKVQNSEYETALTEIEKALGVTSE